MKNWTLVFLLVASFSTLSAQKNAKSAPSEISQPTVNESFFNSMQWRGIGPYRGGRSCAVAGVAGKPNLFYFGGTGGGVWRTTDGGRTWENISDGFFGGSIGAIEVSQSDPNVIFVGGGEQTLRGNISSGSGVWRSDDAGKTWKNMGLAESRNVARVRIHPTNSDLVFVAAIGNPYAPNVQRGIFRSKNAGKTWENVLFVNNEVGAADLCFDPTNPRILYATTWRYLRTPSSMSSGGPGCGIWKSADGGDTWLELTKNEGLPKDTLGIIGVAVSASRPDRIYAQIESKTGGLFRSDDAGKTWKKMNDDRSLRQRAWYYTRIYADPKDEDVVFVMNVAYHKSKDGGRTFSGKYAPHGDHHDLWIDPTDSKRMIIADDGGAQITFDGGETWTTYHNQPTAQFYRVTTDNSFPYRIYGAQQDNSTIRIAHRTTGFSIGDRDWEETAGGESGHIAIDPLNNDIVYGGSYDGYLTRLDHKSRQERSIQVWPDNPMGAGAEAMKYRFQWNFPIFFSPNNPKMLFACSNHLHSTTNEGQTWQVISPDLTRNDRSKMGPSGGPITKDNTSVEYYGTVFAAAESPRVPGLIWAGSDDGLVHLTRPGGSGWENVTPDFWEKGIAGKDATAGFWPMINCIEPDPLNDGGCYVAMTVYKSGDFRPLLFRTKNYGKTWEKITQGIEPEHFTRAIRADSKRPGLLFCGTENGVYMSLNDGGNWQKMQLNLPIVPITDLALKSDQLIAATQGRSFWMIDDLSPVREMSGDFFGKTFHLFRPLDSYRMNGGQAKNLKLAGSNHPGGVITHFFLKEKPADSALVKLAFFEKGGKLIRQFSTIGKDGEKLGDLKQGGNLFTWNMTYPPAKGFDGMILWNGDLDGPRAMPGEYRARLTVGQDSQTVDFQILKDPRVATTPPDFQNQFDFLMAINRKLTEAHEAIGGMRDIKNQLKTFLERLPENEAMKPLRQTAKQIDSTLTGIEKQLYQTQNRSNQDPLNFPIRLTDKLAALNGDVRGADYPPTDAAIAVKNELIEKIDLLLKNYQKTLETEVTNFNKLIREKEANVIVPKKGN